MIAPGIVAGALVAFTLSFDEFIIAFFTSGPTSIDVPDPGVLQDPVRADAGRSTRSRRVLLVVSFTLILIALKVNGSATRRAMPSDAAA